MRSPKATVKKVRSLLTTGVKRYQNLHPHPAHHQSLRHPLRRMVRRVSQVSLPDTAVAVANDLLADGSLYAVDNARAMKLAQRSAEIDDALMTALERWELLGS